MAYQSWSVVFGEQPSAAKWNILGTNDSSFNDGTGIGTNAVAAASLATNAIKLALASATSSQGSITSTSAIQITSLANSVTVPAGSRGLEIEVMLPNVALSTAGNVFVSIWDGTVGSGTQLQEAEITITGAGFVSTFNVAAHPTPAAGAKTYNAGIRVSTGTATIASSATAPSTIITKVI